MLALKEFRGGKSQFAAIVTALSLIVFLVLVLAALADGLFFGATGAIKQSNATHYVYSADAEGSFVRSRLSIDDVTTVSSVDGVEAAGPLGVLLTGGKGPQGALDVAVFGVDPSSSGVPATVVEGRLPAPGEDGVAAVDRGLADDGAVLGSEISVGEVSAKVVGIVEQTSFQLQPSMWTSTQTWRAMRDAVRPELRGQDDAINAIAITVTSERAEAVAAAIADALPGTTVLSADEAALAIPGVEQQNSTLQSIIVITYAVAALVVALFFALLVLEKRALFAVLKAIGTSNRTLAIGVVVQAAGATIVSIAIGALLARAFGLIIPETVPVLFRDQTLLVTAVATLGFGVLGSLFSLRRIARIDPATAIGGAQ